MASKPYALFTHSDEGDIVVRKASEHGLGHLLNPIDPEKTSKEWIELLWKQIILEEQRKPTNRPLWFDSLAVSKRIDQHAENARSIPTR